MSFIVHEQELKKGVILAAGDGDRLGSLTNTCPKVLLPVTDKTTLISSPIEALVSVGISEIAVVVGYLADKVVDELGDGSEFGVRLQYILNDDYLGGNAVSLHKAMDWTEGKPVVLCMGDHLIEKGLVRRLLTGQTLTEKLCVDYIPEWHHQIDEATKVVVDGEGCIKDIGKDLVRWDGLDTGVFMLTGNFFQALDELVRHLGSNVEISDVIRFLISRGQRFDACNASGCFWMDVDTEDDLNAARP